VRERRIEDPERLVGFLHGTARRLALGASRRTARRRTDTASDALPDRLDPRPGPLDASLRGERARLVRRLLVGLRPERDREILARFYLAEETKERLCEQLDLSSAHFDRVLYRAKKRFRSLLENTPLAAPAGAPPA
jgi:RNA polymerase sigma-70 factor (ECF subfamily)